MAKALLLLSVVLMLVTAGLGFATKGKISTLQGTLSETRQNLTAATASANSAKAAQKRAEEDLAAAKTTIEEREAALAAQKAELQTATTSLAEAKAAVEEKTKRIAELEASKTNPIDPTQVDPAAPNPLQAELDRVKAELAEARQVQETLNARATEAESKVSNAERQVQEYKTNYVQTGLSGRVLAYNPGWNFVVLNIGDRQGLKTNTPMIVVRNGQQVARVRVTSVEPTQAIADVVAGSLARGNTVQPGDTVIHQGIRR